MVVGDALLDGWLSGPAHRLGRDAPVPVLEVSASSTAPGGAANVAANLAALGADVELVTVVGDDADGRALRAALAEHGVGLAHAVVELGRATPAKRRLVVSGQAVARYDTACDVPLRRGSEVALADAVTAACPGAAAVLVADYGLGALSERVRRRLARTRRRLLVVDAHDLAPWAEPAPDAVTPSAAEAAALLGDPVPDDRPAWAVARREDLRGRTGAAEVLLTLDTEGAVRLGDGPPLHRPRDARRARRPGLRGG